MEESRGEKIGRLYSIDADEYWAEITLKTFPSHLKELCNISYSPLLEVECFGEPAFRHLKVPDLAPDFLYLDGPALTSDRQVAVDILEIEDRFPPGFFMIVDGRKRNVEFLRQHLRKNYRYVYRKQFRNSVFELIN